MRTLLILTVGLLALPTTAPAHSGGLAADGCHMDRSTGRRHCHRPPGATARRDPPPVQRFAGSGEKSRPATRRPFANCSEARAAGAAPVYRGDPGYAPRLDRDNDGVGCE